MNMVSFIIFQRTHFIVNRIGIIMIRQIFFNKLFNDFYILFKRQLILKSELDLSIPIGIFRRIAISGLKKFIWGAICPSWKMIGCVNAVTSFCKSFFSIDVFDMRTGGYICINIFKIFLLLFALYFFCRQKNPIAQ